MQLILTPQLNRKNLSVERRGDVLIINGEEFDFSGIPDGATLPQSAVDCDALASDVERIDGELVFTLRLPHGSAAPHARRFPAPIIDPPDGPIELPGDQS